MMADLNFNVYNSLILTGIVQGFIFVIIVFGSKKYRTPSTLFLACFILSFSLDNLQYLLEDIGLLTDKQLFIYWFIPFELLSGAFFLLYGLYLINPLRTAKKRDCYVFIPFITGLLMTIYYKVTYLTGFSKPISENYFSLQETILEFIAITFDSLILVYLFFKIRRINKTKFVFPEINPQLSWFLNVLIWLFALSIIWFAVTIADYFYNTNYWYFVYISMAVVIYYMGHIGIYKFGIEQERKKIRNYSIENHAKYEITKQKNGHIVKFEKLFIGEKRYLDPTLTLEKIAEELDLSKSHLSRIINTELQIGFPEYLNALRVKEAKSYLKNPDFAHYTIVAIGLEAGFNSKTTFNTVFKKVTSSTPSEYRSSVLN